MTADIVMWRGITTLDLTPERVINGALAADLKHVVIMGYQESGERYFASNIAEDGANLLLIELCKKQLLE